MTDRELLELLLQKVTGMEKRMTGIESELQEVKLEQQKTNERLTSIEAKQHIIYEQTGKLTEYHSETITRLDQLATKEDLEYFDKKISQHDREIFKIKNRA